MTKRFGVSIPDELLAKLDKLAKKKGYSNRSEVLRDLVRDRFVDEEWAGGNAEVVGTVTLASTIMPTPSRISWPTFNILTLKISFPQHTFISTHTTAWRSWSSEVKARK